MCAMLIPMCSPVVPRGVNDVAAVRHRFDDGAYNLAWRSRDVSLQGTSLHMLSMAQNGDMKLRVRACPTLGAPLWCEHVKKT